jgi:hypothetical protein
VRVAFARLNTADAFTATATFLLLAFDLLLVSRFFSFGRCMSLALSSSRLSVPGLSILISQD